MHNCVAQLIRDVVQFVQPQVGLAPPRKLAHAKLGWVGPGVSTKLVLLTVL